MEIDEVITSLEQVTLKWLTTRLKERGYLESGKVIEVEQKAIASHNSTSAHLAIRYSAGADPKNAPDRLFVKVANPEAPFNKVEFQFYTVVAAGMQASHPGRTWPFPRCYDAAYDADGQGAYLLLEDLSGTHFPAEIPLPPTSSQAGGMVDGLAALHAYWWEHGRLGVDVGRLHTADSLAEMIAWAAGNFGRWVDYMGDRLSAGRMETMSRIFAGWPERRLERLVQAKGITLVHRDTHPLNFLYPYDESADSVRLVDWQSWRVDTGTDDLAYMMACHWYPGYRKNLERPLVERYHQALLTGGVRNYSWDDCWYDYRASVIRCLFFLLGSWTAKRPAALWHDRLEKGLLAFEELSCADLLP